MLLLQSAFTSIIHRAPRATMVEWPSYSIFEPDGKLYHYSQLFIINKTPIGPGTYAFGYEIDDPATSNRQFKNEERLRNGTVRGSYGSLLPSGKITTTTYIADGKGYRFEMVFLCIENRQSIHIINISRAKTANEYPKPEITGNIPDRYTRPSSIPTYHHPSQQVPEENYYLTPEMTSTLLANLKYREQMLNAKPVSTEFGQLFAFPPLRRPNQPGKSDSTLHVGSSENAAFVQNSKLHSFFSSPYYIENIHSKYVDEDETEAQLPVALSSIPANPLTKEAIWYKEFLNKKRLQ